MSIAASAANAEQDIYVVTLPNGNAGDAGGDLAISLANLLKVTKSELLGSASLDGFYADLIGTLGTQSQNAQNQSVNQQSLVDQTKKMQDAISGVNLDEEAGDMIKFQQYYTASSQIIKAAQETFSTLINSL